MNNHTFVVLAYKESTHLKSCRESLKVQSITSNIICATSTPNSYIKNLCEEYSIPLLINPEQKGMAADWNFAYSCATTKYITLAHQDDVYDSNFLYETLKHMENSKKPLIAFTDYYEIRDNEKIISNSLLRIKRIMTIPWRISLFRKSRFITRRIFMFGCPICCPSVTFAKDNLPKAPLFNTEFKNNCDWLAWLNIRDLKGEFVFVPKALMGHRIHLESETSNNISDSTRSREDLILLKKVSPSFFAKFIHRFYVKALDSNKI